MKRVFLTLILFFGSVGFVSADPWYMNNTPTEFSQQSKHNGVLTTTVTLTEQAVRPTTPPASGFGDFYLRAGSLYFLNSADEEVQVIGAGTIIADTTDNTMAAEARVAKSLEADKVTDEPSIMGNYEANGDDINIYGLKGPLNITTNILEMPPNDLPTDGQVKVYSTPIVRAESGNIPAHTELPFDWADVASSAAEFTEQETMPSSASMSAGDKVLSSADDTLSIKTAAGVYRITALYTADVTDTTDPVVVASADSTHDGATAFTGSCVLTETNPASPAVTYTATNATPASGSMTGTYPNFTTPSLTPDGTSDIVITYSATDLSSNVATGTDLVQEFTYSAGGTTCTGTIGETGIADSMSNPADYGFYDLTRFTLGCTGTPATFDVRVTGGETYEFAIYTGVQGGTLTRHWVSGDVAVGGSGTVTHQESYTGSAIPDATDIWLAVSVAATGSGAWGRLAHGTATGDETLNYINATADKPAFPATIADGTLTDYDAIRIVSITGF